MMGFRGAFDVLIWWQSREAEWPAPPIANERVRAVYEVLQQAAKLLPARQCRLACAPCAPAAPAQTCKPAAPDSHAPPFRSIAAREQVCRLC
jgi:hypothetical protein